MKVILINPSSVIYDSYKDSRDYLSKKSNLGYMPPIGLLYLNQVLNENGQESRIIDQAATSLSLNTLLKSIKKNEPDVVGLSILSNSSHTAMKIAGAVKEDNPNVKVVGGNCQATLWSRRLLETYGALDCCVRGEGEHSFLAYLEALEGKKAIEGINGLTFRNGQRIIENKDATQIQDLDDLPFPDRSQLPEYHNDIGGMKFAVGKFTTVLSSRGCPFKCIYCMNSHLGQHKWRSRSVENVMEELRYLDEKNYKDVLFVDDNFTLNRKRVMELCEQIKRERLDINFSARGRVDQTTGGMFNTMVQHGNFRLISFGIESASQKILDYYQKRITPEKALTAIKLARKANFDFVMANFMMGAPGETIDDLKKTIHFIMASAITWPTISIVQATPKTRLWEDLEKDPSLNIDGFWETGVPVVDLKILDYSREYLEKLVMETYKKFISFKRFGFWAKEFFASLTKPYKLKIAVNIIKNLNVIQDLSRTTPNAMSA